MKTAVSAWWLWLGCALLLLPGNCWGWEAIRPSDKLHRGATNALMGWMALPRTMIDCPRAGDLMGIADSLGPFKWVACAAAGMLESGTRELFGAAETVTFGIPWSPNVYQRWWMSEEPWTR